MMLNKAYCISIDDEFNRLTREFGERQAFGKVRKFFLQGNADTTRL